MFYAKTYLGVQIPVYIYDRHKISNSLIHLCRPTIITDTMTQKLLISCSCKGEHHLLVSDASNLTKSIVSKVRAIVASGAKAIMINPNIEPKSVSDNILFETEEENRDFLVNRLEIVKKPFEITDLERYGRTEVRGIVDRVFVDSVGNSNLVSYIYDKCKELRIPINVTNSIKYSTFAMLSTFAKGDLQIGVTTANHGCRMASRIKREMVKTLPSNIDEIVSHVSELRERIRGPADKSQVRASWLSQIIDYFPLSKLGTISIEDLSEEYCRDIAPTTNNHKGKIALVGSGPGSLSMLTLGALNALYSADIVLSDKLVPQEIIDIIPKTTELFIARKFPGNAQNAQQQLLELGLENLDAGKFVVRLKQGDPYIFGRGGQEYKYFYEHHYTPTVIPGLSSALVAPVVANIPTTQRDVSDQVLLCTGTGKKGKIPTNLPEFDDKKTFILLMAIKKIAKIVPLLTETKRWPIDLPVCIVERASCPDQRIIRTTLQNLAEVVDNVESRPPGLIVAGYSCEYLVPSLGKDEKYRIEEGTHAEAIGPVSLTKLVAAISK